MTQPGWYDDPHGGGELRWWDGSAWTGHTQARPQQQSPPRQQRGAVVVDERIQGRPTYADEATVACEGRSIELAQVEWVRYWVTEHKRVGPLSWSSTVQTDYHFEVGRYPLMKAPLVALAFAKGFTSHETQVYERLVDLSRRVVEPRLLAETAARVDAGGTAELGAGVRVGAAGVQGGGVGLAWDEVAGTSVENGFVWVYKKDVRKPVLKVPLHNPNTVLIPPVLDRYRR
ncbi:DUF2510 domain-containing protein [Actinomadura parmotrematis]|uniref:DUF2510 domain-containing protein n=1 Tax=Actinomadura parmotrematis TaxID=2864039 RepID=A0ABS7FQ22_9ACTN|nr:DUF2510 domain-containing protein [Actinomadura parmotrematis]MBW8482411.1 DUF2510 domain-containing protein [Actinomadura parmotrematis]